MKFVSFQVFAVFHERRYSFILSHFHGHCQLNRRLKVFRLSKSLLERFFYNFIVPGVIIHSALYGKPPK